MITTTLLQNVSPGTIIATGLFEDSPDNVNIGTDKGRMKYVGVRGQIDDWAIYCHEESKSIDYIRRIGDKLPKSLVKLVVACTDEALERYRI